MLDLPLATATLLFIRVTEKGKLRGGAVVGTGVSYKTVTTPPSDPSPLSFCSIWGGAIKEIEGNMGSGVATYFRVLRWLLGINSLMFILASGLIVAPGVFISYQHYNGTPPHSFNADDLDCTNPNFFEDETVFHNYTNYVFQFLTGSVRK
eukprot:sb/3473583/